jgi:outer membrane receptor protein involved in Fe transport
MLAHLAHRRTYAAFVLALSSFVTPLAAQNPTGTISGQVVDSGGLAVPGATVTIQSPNLQGVRTAATSENGDYIFPFLPPGEYTITFELSGFATVKQTRNVAATQTVALNVTLTPAAVTETVTVSGRTDAFTHTVQAATNLKQELVAQLPTTRTLLAAVDLAPAVHTTGPNNNVSIAGAMSFESVFMLNGVQIQDNLRGTPLNLFIEDAIQETTVATSGITAEYGRFTGGVVNAITKSGGNQFSGSLRTTFTNDDWRTTSPFEEPKTNDIVPVYEFTAGGPILRNRTWFFGAGRLFERTEAEETGFTRLPYDFTNNEKRFEGKITQTLWSGHTARVAYTDIRQEETNDSFPNPASIMDLNSLYTRQVPQNLLSVHYSGTLSPNFFIEGQYSQRNLTFENSGGRFTDVINGTLLQDQLTGARWWAPTFCGVCDPEERDNQNVLLKGNYFLSTARGAHNIVFGYDTFNDKRLGNNHQSGSDYHVWATTSLIDGETVYPVIRNDATTWIIYWPIREESLGTGFRTHSLFMNDNWSFNNNLTFNLGLRWDRNRGEDAIGQLVANDSAFSPRLGLVWDPTGQGRWSINTSYARYVSALANSIADSSSPAGTPAIFAWFYQGPNINTAGGPLVSSDQALEQVFNWFEANGGQNRSPFFVDIPGVATRIRGSLNSPHANELAVGVSRTLGQRGAVRADVVYRDYNDFYADRIDTSTGQVQDELGQSFDLKLVENTDALDRQYVALNTQVNYRLLGRIDLGGNYTVSRLWGNINGEDIGAGPLTSSVLSYPEYFDVSWSNPEGNLAADQRHRLRAWANIRLPISERLGDLSVAFLEQLQSGTPYGAIGTVRTGDFVANPGYETPPDTVLYYFTDRAEFRTENMFRTDLAVNYAFRLPGTARTELFAQFQVLNLFNQFQLFNLNSDAINTTVLTAVDDSTRFQTFNPFTERPVQGVHWDFDERFGEPINAEAYTLPRTFQFAVGFRF